MRHRPALPHAYLTHPSSNGVLWHEPVLQLMDGVWHGVAYVLVWVCSEWILMHAYLSERVCQHCYLDPAGVNVGQGCWVTGPNW